MDRPTLLAIALVLGTSCLAQVRFGERIGFTRYRQETGQLPGTGEGAYGTLTYKAASFIGTVFLDVPVKKRLLVGAEIGYSERGFRRDPVPPFHRVEELLKSSYVGLTVLPKYLIGQSSATLELCVGVDVAYRLNLRDEGSWAIAYEEGTWPPNLDRDPLMAKLDYSVVVGAGLVAGAGPVKFHLCARYVHGVSNIYKHHVIFSDVNGERIATGPMYNRSFGATVGFSVPLARKGWETRPVE